MEGLQLFVDLVLAVAAAFLGGIVAQRLGQPVILGYLLAGVAIGPFTPGPIANIQSVQVLADIGIAFLMFALGAEVSLAELRRLGRIAVLGGVLQIVLTIGLGPLLAPLLGLAWAQGVFLGALLALSSTVVALRVLIGRGELQALHGRVALGILLVQDLAVVPLVVVLPALATGGEALLQDLGLTALKAGGVLVGAYLVGARVVPWLLRHVAHSRERELFLLGVVALALGTAFATQLAGLSLAFGAFLAGLAVGETDYRAQVVAEVLPLRDLFTSLFFVSVGMLVDLQGLGGQLALVALLSGVVVIGKVVIVVAVTTALGLAGRVALPAALALAQVGEFSFLLAQIGVEAGALPRAVFDLTLATALVTIVLTPFLLRTTSVLVAGLERLPGLGPRFAPPALGAVPERPLRHHTVICGFGRVGQELAVALEKRGLRYVVIEYNPDIVRALQARGVPVIYGDAGNPAVLEQAQLGTARLMAVLVHDPVAAERAVRYARQHYPRLDIVARAADSLHVRRLQEAGATEVVQPEFEAGVEVIRHVMHRYGADDRELSHLLVRRRAAFYAPETGER